MLKAVEVIDYVCAGMLARHKNWRAGQGLFNAILLVRPDLAEKIRGTDKDCFHDNKKLSVVVSWLKSELAKEAAEKPL